MRNFSSSIINPCGHMKMIDTKSFLKGAGASALMVLAAAFLFLSLFPAAAKASGSYNTNLVSNGDAEENNTIMAGWDASSEPTAFIVLMPVDSWVGPSIDGGNAFTYNPKAPAEENLSQTIDISNLTSDIATGMVCFSVSANTRIKMPSSTGAIVLELLDESSNVLATYQASEVGDNNFLWEDLHIDRNHMDARTRRLRIKLVATISDYNSLEDIVQFDCISLTLSRIIPAASVSGIVAPVTGGYAKWHTDLAPGSSGYTVTGLTWLDWYGNPAYLVSGYVFSGNMSYVAQIELTANTGFRFESDGLTPSVNTGTPQQGTVSGGDVEGNKLTFAVHFPTTAPASVTGIMVYTQPAVLSYTEGQALNLNGIMVVLSYNDCTSLGGLYSNDFAEFGITANPANGTILTPSNHGQQISLTANGFTTYTHALTVVSAASAIAANPDSIQFASAIQGYGPPPDAQTVTITNTGNCPVKLTAPASTYYVVGTLSKTSLNAGDNATFTIRPRPGLGAGTNSETITVLTDRETSAGVYVTFPVIAATHTISFSKVSLDFGSAAEGYAAAPAAQTVTVTNTGNSPVTLTQPTSTDYVVGTLSKTTLNAGASATFTVQPKTGLREGIHSETITVKTNHGTSNSVDVSFTCTEPTEYEILSGVGGAYQQNGSGSSPLTITSNGDVSNFTGLTLNGDLVDESNYDVTQGSTIVTLHQDFLESLAPGTYTLRLHYIDGFAEAEFVVQDQLPVTGDNNALAVFGALTALCLIALRMIKRKQASR